MSLIYIYKKDIEWFYDFLDLKQYDVRLVKDNIGNHVFIDNYDEFMEICLKNNSIKNIFVGINERKLRGKTDDSVIELKNICIEIMPYNRRTVDNKLQRMYAYGKCSSIQSWFIENGFENPLMINTENGYYLITKIKPISVNNKNRQDIIKRYKIFGNMLMSKFSDRNAYITNSFNISRGVRVPGTVSVHKGEISHCSLVSCPYKVFSEDEKLMKYIKDIEIPTKVNTSYRMIP